MGQGALACILETLLEDCFGPAGEDRSQIQVEKVWQPKSHYANLAMRWARGTLSEEYSDVLNLAGDRYIASSGRWGWKSHSFLWKKRQQLHATLIHSVFAFPPHL